MKPEIAPDYYLQNFQTLIHYVYHSFPHLLCQQELKFYRDFQKLGIQAQRLYVRLISRKKHFFRVSKISYEEIPDLDGAIDLLDKYGFIATRFAISNEERLNSFTKPELLEAAKICSSHSVKGTQQLKKQALIYWLLETCGPAIVQFLTREEALISPCYRDILKTYQLIYFGNLHQDLTEFIVLDLGLYRYESYIVNKEDHPIKNRLQLNSYINYQYISDFLFDSINYFNGEQLEAIHNALPPSKNNSILKRKYDKLTLKLARQCERLGELNRALALYQHTESSPSLERQARIYKKIGANDQAQKLCSLIKSNPQSESELEFAVKFSAGLAGKRLAQTENDDSYPCEILATKNLTHPADLKTQDHLRDTAIEKQVCDYLGTVGYQAYHVENTLFNAVFGLAFWNIIFSPCENAFYHPYQKGPVDLFYNDFQKKRNSLIENKLTEVRSGDQWKSDLLSRYDEKIGINNYLVHWTALDINLLQQTLKVIPSEHWYFIFRRLVANIAEYKSGFPDLICFYEQGYKLIEVKSINDSIRPNQNGWLKYFNRHGIPASLLKLQ